MEAIRHERYQAERDVEHSYAEQQAQAVQLAMERAMDETRHARLSLSGSVTNGAYDAHEHAHSTHHEENAEDVLVSSHRHHSPTHRANTGTAEPSLGHSHGQTTG